MFIRATIDGETISRPYTLTSNNADLGCLNLFIKTHPNGKVATYLQKLEIDDQVEFVGPKGAMKYNDQLCRHIGMVAERSGITPMYRVIRAICEDLPEITTVSLLYVNKTENDILLRERLDGFAERYPKKFQVHYILDRPPQKWAYSKGHVTKEPMRERFPAAHDGLKVFLCGPPPMIDAMKKSLEPWASRLPVLCPGVPIRFS